MIMMRAKTKVRVVRRQAEESDGGEAFVHDFRHGFIPIDDGDAEAFGEEFVAGATSNEAVAEFARNEGGADEMREIILDWDDDDVDEAEL
jgi:hypothetical protein